MGRLPLDVLEEIRVSAGALELPESEVGQEIVHGDVEIAPGWGQEAPEDGPHGEEVR